MIFDFESGITGWTAVGDATISVETTDPGSGTQSLRIEGPDVHERRADFAVTGLTVGVQYSIRFKWKSEIAAGTAYAYVIAVQGDRTDYIWGDVYSPAGWTQTAGGSFWCITEDIVIQAYGSGYAGAPTAGDAWLFDDIILEEYTGVTEDFEAFNDSHWGVNDVGSFIESTDQAHSGTTSLLIEGADQIRPRGHSHLLGLRPHRGTASKNRHAVVALRRRDHRGLSRVNYQRRVGAVRMMHAARGVWEGVLDA